MSNYLWTDESVYCECGHHIDQHITNGFPEDLVGKTINGNTYNHGTCLFKSDHNDADPFGDVNEFYCKCTGFKPYKTKAK